MKIIIRFEDVTDVDGLAAALIGQVNGVISRDQEHEVLSVIPANGEVKLAFREIEKYLA